MSRLTMLPEAGERMVRFVGDFVEFTLKAPVAEGWRARLRTNLGRAAAQRREIIESRFGGASLAGAAWRDVPMERHGDVWKLSLPVTEVGFFSAKPYAMDAEGFQHWPAGEDIGISVHPAAYRTGNTIYCAFPRMFGPNKTKAQTIDEALEKRLCRMEDEEGYTIIPKSGTLRDLKRELPFIIGELGCRIVHLLPVSPTPTTMARMGRFGSPYAVQNLTGIDPALVDFDKKSTGVEQFRELTFEAHRLGGRVFLDLVINHTGWGSNIYEDHPEWFIRDPDTGEFESPGAWGVKWGDLVELAHKDAELWEYLAGVFLEWCRRGVDGFRCDAGYKVPAPAWQHIIARVRQEFPDAVFLLEGLGGGWDDTATLLTDGGMQWAYSELFQEYNGAQVSGYLDHALKQSQRVGLLVHYSETHDNDRLAKKGRAWSLLRNRLCALTSVSGGYGFTCGVEWLAPEKIKVHGAHGLNWGGDENIVPELTQLNRLLHRHPCFFDGARLQRLSEPGEHVYALWRESADGKDALLILANTDTESEQTVTLKPPRPVAVDLLGGKVAARVTTKGRTTWTLPPAGVLCLAENHRAEDHYEARRLLAARALTAVTQVVHPRNVGQCDWRVLADMVAADPGAFLARVSRLDPDLRQDDLADALNAVAPVAFPNVIDWQPADTRRVTVVPDEHWLLVQDDAPFRVTLSGRELEFPVHLESVAVNDRHLAWFAPRNGITDRASLTMERYGSGPSKVVAELLFQAREIGCGTPPALPQPDDIVLLTNGRGAMARMCVDLGRVTSKYDCVLGANLDATLPVDRHVFVKRLRAWIDADGFITPLNHTNLVEFKPGPPAEWRFVASAGDGRSVEITLTAAMVPDENTTVLRFHRPDVQPRLGRALPDEAHVRLTLRFDIEDRNFHWETKRNESANAHFNSHLQPLRERPGFAFDPGGRSLRIWATNGRYHPAPEWSENLPHPVEASRGMTGAGDGFSPGWFSMPLDKDASGDLVVTAEQPETFDYAAAAVVTATAAGSFAERMTAACRAFVVARDEGKTVIAGYPWFLDWGRDTLICARGLLAAGMIDEVREIVRVFGKFEENGTLPNTIHGANASNRDTSDAPLWFGVVCEDLAAITGESVYDLAVDDSGRQVRDVLRSIAVNIMDGTPNGIRMDAGSALVWSPSHFTWMDTNYPAGTPREGYPIEIQALWVRLLRTLDRIGAPPEKLSWNELAELAATSLADSFWVAEKGWLGDVLLAESADVPAVDATLDEALRSNCLLAVSLGLVTGERARSTVTAARRHLVVPGALRSLAPLPVTPPLAIQGSDGQLLNDPDHPYWGHYEGDEDTRRKPAYHNGTAWTWPFPVFCEAMMRAWEDSPAARDAARAYLASMEHIFNTGCLDQMPEVIDGDAPHQQRGCDAQAWGVTEALRVWKITA